MLAGGGALYDEVFTRLARGERTPAGARCTKLKLVEGEKESDALSPRIDEHGMG